MSQKWALPRAGVSWTLELLPRMKVALVLSGAAEKCFLSTTLASVNFRNPEKISVFQIYTHIYVIFYI